MQYDFTVYLSSVISVQTKRIDSLICCTMFCCIVVLFLSCKVIKSFRSNCTCEKVPIYGDYVGISSGRVFVQVTKK